MVTLEIRNYKLEIRTLILRNKRTIKRLKGAS